MRIAQGDRDIQAMRDQKQENDRSDELVFWYYHQAQKDQPGREAKANKDQVAGKIKAGEAGPGIDPAG